MEGMSRMFGRVATHLGVLVALMCTIGGPASLLAQTPPTPMDVILTVQNGTGATITTGFRWLLQEDRMFDHKKGVPCGSPNTTPPNQPCIPGTSVSPDTLGINFHKSYMPPVDKGDVAGGTATITVPDNTKKYFVSVLPHAGATVETSYSISGASLAAGQTSATIVVPSQPIPTAQIFVRAFEDRGPIDNGVSPNERGLGGFNVTIADAAGQVLTDAFGNPLGTSYDDVGNVILLGSGIITTITQAEIDAELNPYNLEVGEGLIKNLVPGKYEVQIHPVAGLGWQQTTTIEGKKGNDAWVKGKEPRFFESEPGGHHVQDGFVQPFADNTVLTGGRNITGTIVNLHMSRPPDYTMYTGQPLPGCWVGLNEFLLGRAGRGLYAGPCDANSQFTIPNVPPGTYQLAIWDEFLDNIFATVPVTVAGGDVNLGDVGVFRWFGTLEHNVFYDSNQNGIRDTDINTGELEAGMRDQNVNLRYRDGSIYQAYPTDTTGYVPFDQVFPFFNWFIAEVDYARFKPTGMTVTVDAGGVVAQDQKLTPQIQADGTSTTRTELGPVLLEGYQSFLGTLNVIDWGKVEYCVLPDGTPVPNCSENGGITGIVHYPTTRAEDDPRFAGAEDWEPGIPRVPVFLYRKDLLDTHVPFPGDPNPSKILNVNGVPGIQLADVDHAPFGWSTGGPMGQEDVKRNNLGGPTTFSAGDAVQISTTDSWEDHLPTGCPAGNAPGAENDPFYLAGRCYDGLRNFNQVRGEGVVFDGGLAFFTYVPGGWTLAASQASQPVLPPDYYIVEAVTPKGYEHQKEEDKNVAFGDASVVSPLLLAPICVGDLHLVPPTLTLFPTEAAPNAGAWTPLCDRKEVLLTSGSNAAADFFMFTDVPVAAQVTGMVLNDLANEFDPLSPNFGEKAAPSWLPLSFRDWTGHEVVRTYTDQFGNYNAMLPSTYTINAPTPSGVSPHMMQVCLNNPGPIQDPNDPTRMILDPFYNKHYGQVCYTLQYYPGTTTYADTPILPIAAFVSKGNVQTDCECPNGTPRIFSVTGPGNIGPYVTGTGQQLTIKSMGMVQVPDPNAPRVEGNYGLTIERDFGFGSAGTVTLGGLPLTNVSWSNDTITATVPPGASTGQLVVTRAAAGLLPTLSTTNSVTVTVGAPVLPATVRTVAPGQSIQAVLDVAVAGDLILVQPGTYYEMLIMTKPVKLQGWGAGSTHILPNQELATQLQTWLERVNNLVNCPTPTPTTAGKISLLPGQANNLPLASAPCGFNAGSGLFGRDQGAGIFVGTQDGVFTSLQRGRIDGFTIAGSATSPGIVVNGYARFLEISNNQVANNQGTNGGGIRLGDPTITVSAQNNNVSIHHNHIIQNGSLFAPGAGVALNTGSDSYQLTDNYVCGNFAIEDGGGVAHYGFSDNGLIARNKIIFNQTFVQSVGGMGGTGSGGGLLVAGLPPVVGDPVQISEGAGSVTILSNLIQGNNAGSGDGAGVMLRNINGLDVLASATNNASWYQVRLFNNIIVNNVAGLAGGGIALQDATRVTMTNNTVAHNDSTATAGLAFSAGVPNRSNPQPAGIVSNRHSAGLCQAFNQGGVGNCPLTALRSSQYSDPVMQNNIVLNNRSMFWQVNTAIPPVGQLNFSGMRDFAVLPAGSGFLLHPLNSILSSTAGTASSGTNQPVTDSASVFGDGNSYINAPPGLGTVQPDGTIIQLEFTTSLATAAALDEGGNYIEVHYAPLSPAGNYHLATGSPAIDAGNDAALTVSALLGTDYDGQPRPRDGGNPGSGFNGGYTDIGADEAPGSVVVPSVSSFVVRRADTDAIIVPSLTNGATVDLFALCGGITCQVNIEAVPSAASLVQSVRLVLSGATTRTTTDNNSPYTMLGNPGGNYAGFTINRGVNTMTATPYSLDNAGGTAGTQLAVTFTVVLAPVITSQPVTAATIGNPYTYNVNAQPLAAGLTFSLTQVPPADRGVMTINSGTGIISWIPRIPNPTVATPYSNAVTVRVTDNQGRFSEQTFTITVSPKPETIVVTQAIFHNPDGNGNTDAWWTVSGTSNVDAGDCTGSPNDCGNLTIYRVRGGGMTVIGTATVNPTTGAWSVTATVLAGAPVANPAQGDSIRVRSLTGGVGNSAITYQTN